MPDDVGEGPEREAEERYAVADAPCIPLEHLFVGVQYEKRYMRKKNGALRNDAYTKRFWYGKTALQGISFWCCTSVWVAIRLDLELETCNQWELGVSEKVACQTMW